MRRKLLAGGDKSSLLLIAVLCIFSTLYFSSCAKEDVVPEEIADVGDVLGKKGDEGNGYKDLPDDCHCYMKVLSIENAPTDWWYIFDYTDGASNQGYSLIISPTGQWIDADGYPHDFPSDFGELDIPSNGVHDILVWMGEMVSDMNFAIHVEVHCQNEWPDGTPAGGRTYNLSFVYYEGQDWYSLGRLFTTPDLMCEYAIKHPKKN